MQEENIEVEIRSFISKEKYEELLKFFKQNVELVKEDFQETHYFDCEQDLRIQKNNFGSKIWMKKGKIHDDAREEIEIKTDNKDFEKLGKLFNQLGNNVEIKWLRDRKQFNWQGIKVCLDYTHGYGYIIELEKMSSEENKEKILEELKQKLKELNITLSSKEEFNEKFEDYKKNWRKLIENDVD
jgi:predicted adenylyl cyclase CyaB